ncbi:hypothetical protein ABZT26_38435, partial [Streptomyces sp. NPDC005395]|uniref:hypothetical protein n=1 Tax=Streptomyces sp. NPDC005395 TaxID=3157042 RepID=UPI0033B89687
GTLLGILARDPNDEHLVEDVRLFLDEFDEARALHMALGAGQVSLGLLAGLVTAADDLGMTPQQIVEALRERLAEQGGDVVLSPGERASLQDLARSVTLQAAAYRHG